MSTGDELVWEAIDKETEVAFYKDIKFIRPIDHKTLPVDCPVCKVLLSNVDDVSSVRENDACESCYLTHYYPNKEKWEKGWRPSL